MKMLLAACVLMTGCATAQPVPVTVRVPVPVPCDVPDVARPAMPTEALPVDAGVFIVGRALWAEIEVREGYEAQLRAAAGACRRIQ